MLKASKEPVSEHIKSVEHVLEQISCVLALESVVTHHELGYTGTFDCVVKYRFVIIILFDCYSDIVYFECRHGKVEGTNINNNYM